MKPIISILALVILFSACHKTVVKPQPQPKSNYATGPGTDTTSYFTPVQP